MLASPPVAEKIRERKPMTKECSNGLWKSTNSCPDVYDSWIILFKKQEQNNNSSQNQPWNFTKLEFSILQTLAFSPAADIPNPMHTRRKSLYSQNKKALCANGMYKIEMTKIELEYWCGPKGNTYAKTSPKRYFR